MFLYVSSSIRALHRWGAGFDLRRKDISFLFACLCICSSVSVLLISLRYGFIEQSPIDELSAIPKHIQRSIRNETIYTLANHILSSNPNSNIVFSPISIHVGLGLIAAGSQGQTLDQLLSFLKTNSVDVSSELVPLIMNDGSPNGGPRLHFVNGVWVEQTRPLKPSFKQVVDTVYKVDSKQVDFREKADEVTKEVNLWVKTQTSGLIKDILPQGAVNKDTILAFANALYFKGAWSQKFLPSMTRDFDFHLPDGSKIRVPFMTSNKEQLIQVYDGFKVLGLPYLQGKDKLRFTMYFFLHDEKDGLPSLIIKIGSESDFLEHHIPHFEREVERLLIPKFKISFGFEASYILKELGLELPFSGGLDEIANSTTGNDVFISSIHHKSFVEVNEEGTEATAATLIGVAKSMPVEFVTDHPFLFVIREDTSGAMLFMGQVNNPGVH